MQKIIYTSVFKKKQLHFVLCVNAENYLCTDLHMGDLDLLLAFGLV